MTRTDVNKMVYEYDTMHERGFTQIEQELFLTEFFPEIDKKKYYSYFFGTTYTIQDGFAITHYTDIVTSIMCCLEDRDMNFMEFD